MKLIHDSLRLANLLEQALSEVRKKTRVNQLQLRMLLALGDGSPPEGAGRIRRAASCEALARELCVDRSAVGMQMRGLIESGFAEKADLSEFAELTGTKLDGRQRYYQLTPAGKKAYDKVQKQIDWIERAVEGKLTVKGAEAYGRTTRVLCELVVVGAVDEMLWMGEQAKRERRLRQ
ncbi:hypothetical protein [Roseateles sp.]|uniref:hypothetical protein n=1 Tax=Roseateles sp. TaxID=1971397 RepID=UPI0039EC2C80